MAQRVSNQDATALIRNRTPFATHTGSLSGLFTLGAPYNTGYLPDEHRHDLREAWEHAGTDLFVVYSYGTPIAWHDGERWTRPAVKYSVTTSRHQGRCPVNGSR